MAALPFPGALLLGSVTFGLGVGMLITLPPLLVQEEFGTASFGTVFAMVNGAMQVGVAWGPSIVGVFRDRGGGYEGALWALVAIEATAVVLVLSGWRLRTTLCMPDSQWRCTSSCSVRTTSCSSGVPIPPMRMGITASLLATLMGARV
jgi:MFS family permease